MRKISFTIGCMLLLHTFLGGQNPILDAYINEGLEANQSLKQRQLDYARSLFALKEAKGLFFPDISINARYTVADGGRVISFPVGDLLNPVYNTLNLLTMANQFPEIENQEFTFYRPKEHETKLSLVQPIFNSDIIYNVKIKEELSAIAEVDIDQYKRELVMEIKTAYYNFQKAYSLGNLIDSTMLLVKENLRVSEILFRNDLVTVDVVYRSDGEVSMVEAEKAKITGMIASSRAYFNFLLNKPLEDEIELYQETPAALLLSLVDAQDMAVMNREELEILKKNKTLNKHLLGLQKGNASPDLFGAVNYGFQGEEYKFTGDDDFVFASLVLQWNIFHGMSNKNMIHKTRLDGEKLDEMLSETEMKIRMQVINYYYTTVAAYDAIKAAEKRVLSAQKAFRLIELKYSEGQITLLEYIDARTNYTNAESNLILATSDYFICLAQLECASALQN